MHEDTPGSSPVGNGMGETAMVFGIMAVLFSFVPLVGDLVAAPAALVAIVLGVVGVRRVETGRATNPGKAAAGVILGIVAASFMMVMLIATMSPRY